MPDTNDTTHHLITKYLKGTLTPDEEDRLSRWMHESAGNRALFEQLTNEQWINARLRNMYKYNESAGWEKLRERMTAQQASPVQMAGARVRSVWKRVTVAASIVFALSAGGYFLFTGNHSGKHPDVRQAATPTDIKAPATNRATITLADRSVIFLDSADNGRLASQGQAHIIKLDNGRIVYEATAGTAQEEKKYNTLTNPRGSQVIDMKLSDGSHVWLNAGSSITFPAAFSGGERRVSITGEAYFEVQHDAARPFRVDVRDQGVVEVLGTHFNINAYDDEQSSRITLLEGAINVRRGGTAYRLKPGQQAQLTAQQITVADNANIEEVMAWKNGRFMFNKTGIQATMRQVARWYDAEIVYQEPVQGYFSGSISRSENISTILKKLELTGEAHFVIDGKKILVKN